MARKKPPTEWEQRVLDVLLVELRRAVRVRRQSSIIIDPFTMGGGTYISAGPSSEVNTYELVNNGGAATKRSPKR